MIDNILSKYLSSNLLIKKGSLFITLHTGEKIDLNKEDTSIIADIIINNPLFYSLVIKRGDIGFSEAYIKGYFTTSNLVNLLKVLTINLEDNSLDSPSSVWHKIKFKLINYLRKNSIKQSKKNISFHYDLGNDFYSLWLDKTMTYSSALYKNDNEDLSEAQANKYNRILDILENKLGNNLNILEVGCGFGGFAEFALKRGHKITSITISQEQFSYAQNRLQDFISKGSCNLLFEDYRNIKEEYDAIVSIEMFEAVGKEYWNSYFNMLYKNLKSKGIAIIQTIYIQDKYFNDYKNGTDFIRHYIFPGGFLPSDINFVETAEKFGLKSVEYLSFGLDYSKTLEEWLKIFDNKNSQVVSLGYSEEFIKMWRFYLAFCSAGFYSNRINVAQFELLKN